MPEPRDSRASRQLPRVSPRVNYGKIGRIASTSAPLLLQRGLDDWLLQRDWADAEQIESFAGQPLCFKGEVLGVVAVFSGRRIERREFGWLRVFADHAAVAIGNARAFQEIEVLKDGWSAGATSCVRRCVTRCTRARWYSGARA